MTTPIDTAHLRALLAASPTRPGTWAYDDVEVAITHRDENDDQRWTLLAQPLNDRTATIHLDPADAALICAAVNALPALLDEVERLRAVESVVSKVAAAKARGWVTLEAMERVSLEGLIESLAVDAARKAGA